MQANRCMTHARDVANHLADLLCRERVAAADFLVALADFDRQRLWLELGHATLFSFLRRELGLSAGAAQYRKTAAELVQRYPEVEEALRSGKLCLSSVIEFAKVVTPQNVAELLPRFFGLSSREAALVAVSLRPVENPPRRDVVTSVPSSVAGTADDGAPLLPAPPPSGAAPFRAPETDQTPERAADAGGAGRAGGAGPSPRGLPRPWSARVEPLDASCVRLHTTVSRRFLEKLEAARAALSHSHPAASIEEILEVGLDLVVERHAKRRGLVGKPRAEGRPARPDHVSAAVKRAVWKRDGGRCQWPLDSGGICGSTVRVQFDHFVTRARGGPPTAANLRLLCDVHQAVAARRVFGDAWMDRFTRKGAPGPRPP